jgi:hypothetical protein
VSANPAVDLPVSHAYVESLKSVVQLYQISREQWEAFVRITLQDGVSYYVQGIEAGPLDGYLSIGVYPTDAVPNVVARPSDGVKLSQTALYVPLGAIFKVEVSNVGPRTEHSIGFRAE